MPVGTGPIDLALALAGAPFAAAGAYLTLLSAAARRRPAPAPGRDVRFDVVVPAHNEALGIEATVASLLGLDYPRDRFRVVVVADNCSDDTAERARRAGATVLERHDAERRGKGYALALAYGESLAGGFADAVVVVDADTVVAPNLLGAFAARFEGGAECVQAHYGVRNVGDSWRTRLMAVAFALYHTLRSLGRERLGLSCGLRGNGMGFTCAVLRRVPHAAFSVVEDVEYGVALGLAGVRVWYVDETSVLGEMPATTAASQSQRERWEAGRGTLVRGLVPALLRRAVRRRDAVALDLAADLLVPPLTTLVAGTALGQTVALALYVAGLAGAAGLVAWGIALAGLIVYIARGCVLSGGGARVVLDLLAAPSYMLWKLAIRLRPSRRRADEWVRTRRTAER